MTEQEREKVKRHPLSIFEDRPDWARPDDWKNRHRISAKLTPVNYQDFYKYCTKHGWSFSSGANALIATHPEINKEFKNNA